MLCLYGVVRDADTEALDVAASGVHRSEVRLVASGAVAALVSELDGELLARRRDVEAHLDVLERAFASAPLLPFRFGTLVDDEESLRRVLADDEAAYLRLLDDLSGLVQMTVKAVRSDDAAIRAVVSSDDRLRRVVRRLQGSTVIADQIQLGEQVAAAVQMLSERDAYDITVRLDRLASAVVAEQVAPPAVVSLALLMPPEDIPGLDQAVANLFDDYGSRLTFDYAGPMPPYSFVGRGE
jgi:hypothetical protein